MKFVPAVSKRIAGNFLFLNLNFDLSRYNGIISENFKNQIRNIIMEIFIDKMRVEINLDIATRKNFSPQAVMSEFFVCLHLNIRKIRQDQ